MLIRLTLSSAALLAVLMMPARVALAQNAGSVAGSIVDASTGAPLSGADVALDGTAFSGATDRSGTFRLLGVPAGKYSLIASYLGHGEQRADVEVTPAQTFRIELRLSAVSYTESVQVRGELAGDGQAAALNQQRTALNITNVVSADQIGAFPDPNAAEAAQRIPGVSIARDQGEGRYVLVRGTEARLNSMMIDGERIPAPEGDTRQIALDAVPADQLQAIEVSKAITPDMDADSIGGSVNLVTRQAVNKPTALFSAAGGFNALQDSGEQGQFSGTLGRRFGAGRVGLLLGGSGSSLNRGSENFEADYANGALGDFQLRDYQINRERYGLNLSADSRVRDSVTLMFKVILNEFRDYEVNNRIRFRPGNRRIEHVLKNRNQNQHIRSASLGLQSIVGGRATLDTRFAWAQSREEQPDRLDTIFRQTGINFAPNVSAGSIDPENIQPNPSANNAANATLNAWQTEIFTTTDRDLTASFNLRVPMHARDRLASFIKVGAKVKDKSKDRVFEAGAATPGTTVRFPELADPDFDNGRFLNFFPAGYTPFPGISAGASRDLFNRIGRARFSVDREGDAENYDASERVLAGYAMAEFFIGDRLMILPGVRIESTKVDYTGYQVIYDEGGDYASTTPVTGGDIYSMVLPGFHLRYSLDTQTNIRAAVTRSLARPNYYDLVPYQLVFQEDGEIARGNASLKPTTSTNVDLLVERYFSTVGAVSGGVFYKQLTDYVYPFVFEERVFGDVFDVTQPRNGDDASLWGLEIAVQNQFRALPAPWDGIGIYANYTWTNSSATFPGRAADAKLPGQSSHLGNLAVSYDRRGFSARASWNFHGKYIDAVGQNEASDVYYDNHTQLDLSVSQRVARNIRVFADFLNLTNAPLRYYEGSTSRPIQEEYYRWWSSFGVKVNF